MRYEKLAKFKEVGEKGKEAFGQKTVAIVGLGNVGSNLAVMLLQSGISLRLIDKGRVDLRELSSQALYLEEDHDKFKAKQAKKYLETINPKAKVRTFHEDLGKQNIYLIDADVVVDATGDLKTAQLISDEAKKKKTPMIFSAVSGSQGLIVTSDKGISIDKVKAAMSKMKPIDEAGLINPTVHVAAAIIAAKVMKILLKKPYTKEMVQFDTWQETMKKQKI